MPPPKRKEPSTAANPPAQKADQALQSLLAEHRRLALIRAPLAQRIPVLRHLLQYRPQHEGWYHDLNEYERIRLQQVEAEVKHARTVLNLKELCGFQKELEAFTVRTRNAQRVLAVVRRYVAEVRLKHIEYDLEDLQREFVDASERRDVKEAKRIRDRLLHLANQAKELLEEQLRDAQERKDAAVARDVSTHLAEKSKLIRSLGGG